MEYQPPQRVQDVKERYEKARRAQEPWTNNAVEDLQYWGGSHFTEEELEELRELRQADQPVQIMYQIVEAAVAMLTANRPSVRGAPREPSDNDDAKVVSDLFAWIWQESEGNRRFKSIVRDQYVQSRGVALVYYDPNADFGAGEVRFRDLDPKEVYPDPDARDPLWTDATYVVTRSFLTLQQIAMYYGPEIAQTVRQRGAPKNTSYDHYASKDAADGSILLGQDVVRDEAQKRYETLDFFEKKKVQRYRVKDDDGVRSLSAAEYREWLEGASLYVYDGQREVVTNGADALQAYAQLGSDGAPGMFMEMRPNAELQESGYVDVRPYYEDRVFQTSVAGDVLLYEDSEHPTAHYPIVPFPDTGGRVPYPISAVRRMKGLQDVVNKTQNIIIAHASNSASVKGFIPRGVTNKEELEQEFARTGVSFMEYDVLPPGAGGANPITLVQFPPLAGEFFLQQDRAIALMERIAGVYNVQQGDAGAAPETYRATVALDQFGLRRIKSRMDDIYASLEVMARVILDYAQAYYTEEKVVRVIGPSGDVSQSRLNYFDPSGVPINDIASIRYDVVIVPGSTLPTNQMANMERYLELFRLGIVDDQAVLQNAEIPDAEEILERKAIISQLVAANEAQLEKIKELEGDLQTWQREAMHADQQAELEKFKASLAAIKAPLKAGIETYKKSLKMQEKLYAAQLRERGNNEERN